MLAKEFIDMLACPLCKGGVIPTDDGGYLLCAPCGLKYPVREGIPVMLTDEAEKCGDSGPGNGNR